jgi:hypothetical protein
MTCKPNSRVEAAQSGSGVSPLIVPRSPTNIFQCGPIQSDCLRCAIVSPKAAIVPVAPWTEVAVPGTEVAEGNSGGR